MTQHERDEFRRLSALAIQRGWAAPRVEKVKRAEKPFAPRPRRIRRRP